MVSPKQTDQIPEDIKQSSDTAKTDERSFSGYNEIGIIGRPCWSSRLDKFCWKPQIINITYVIKDDAYVSVYF